MGNLKEIARFSNFFYDRIVVLFEALVEPLGDDFSVLTMIKYLEQMLQKYSVPLAFINGDK